MFLVFASLIAWKTNIFNQYIDHSSPDVGNFSQKFYFDKSQVGDNPVRSLMIYISGKTRLSTEYLDTLTPIYEIAKKTHSVYFALEHRYFGDSQIFENLSLDNLSYLTVENAVDDISTFVQFVKNAFCGKIDETSSNPCRVALFGEEYAASLCVWAKQQYPNLIDSLWASSAPLIASKDFYSFDSYHAILLGKPPLDCARPLSAYLKIIEDVFLSENETEIEKIYKQYNIPKDMVSWNFLYAVSNILYELLDREENRKYLEDFCSSLSIINLSMKITEALKNLNRSITYYDPTWPRDPEAKEMRERRVWTYLMCNELGWIPVSPPGGIQNRILQRSINSSYVSENICRALFGFPTTKKMSYFNQKHGNRLPGINSVVYTTALTQQYSELSCQLQSDPSREIVSLSFTDLTNTPMGPQAVEDSKELVEVRKTAVLTMISFIGFNESCSGQHGQSLLHRCLCNDGWGGEQCESKVNLKYTQMMTATTLVVPTAVMFIVGIIAWITFVEPTKDNKLKQII